MGHYLSSVRAHINLYERRLFYDKTTRYLLATLGIYPHLAKLPAPSQDKITSGGFSFDNDDVP